MYEIFASNFCSKNDIPSVQIWVKCNVARLFSLQVECYSVIQNQVKWKVNQEILPYGPQLHLLTMCGICPTIFFNE